MSLVSVLSKVAIGAIAAKGVGSMLGGNSGGGGLASALGSMMGGGGSGGSPLGALAGMLGGGQQQGGGGALGALANMMGGGQQQSGGALGALSNMLGGGGQQGGGMLAGLLGSAQQSGGLGGLLDSLGGGGGLGAMLNQALQGQEPEPSQTEEEQAALLLKAMIMAAKSDGQIDEAEQQKIAEHLGDVSPEELEVVKQAMAAPVDPEGLAASVPAGMEQQVYLMSLLGIDLDSKSEAQYLNQLAQALKISPEQANAIHEKLGAPKLYG